MTDYDRREEPPHNQEAAELLRSRGWQARRWRLHESRKAYEGWIWPPTEGAPWRSPTWVIYDGRRFHIYYAQHENTRIDDHSPMDYLNDFEALRGYIAQVEAWPTGNLDVGKLN